MAPRAPDGSTPAKASAQSTPLSCATNALRMATPTPPPTLKTLRILHVAGEAEVRYIVDYIFSFTAEGPPLTTGTNIGNPLSDPIPVEVPLPNAPLERVVAQVRFSPILKIEQRDYITAFQDGIREQYPSLEHDRTQLLALGPEGMVPKEASTRWRFIDVSGEWTVSLAPDFVAIETTRYTSRADFFARFAEVIEHVHAHFRPGLVERIGVRYIDRIEDDGLAAIASLVRPELAGVLQTPLRSAAVHALSEHIFEVDRARLLARWGILRANCTVDPAAIEPIEESSWLLDLDMFRVRKQPFDPAAIVAEARGYAERIYCFFRWAVTPAFLARYGGSA
jgi:uncharacterized protein (TIGR04255 family)